MAFHSYNAGGGSGTVTSVSVVTANGVSGSVATATTTPAITLTLGAITPSSVVSTGSIRSNTSLILEETGAGTDIITIQAPASIGASYTLTLPDTDGDADQVLTTNGSGVLSWTSNGAGDVTSGSNLTDNAIVRGDGGAKGVQTSAVLIDDSNNVTGIASLTLTNTGLHLLDTNATHDLIIAPGSNLTADHTLTIVTGDADRSLTLTGDATISGTNTGDQTIAAGSQIAVSVLGATSTVSSTFYFDATVGATGADYTTVKGAVDAGKARILVLNSTTEVANTDIVAATIPNLYMYIKAGATVAMGAFRFTDTGSTLSVTVEGQGTISYAHTSANEELFDLVNNITLTLRDITITNTSNQDGCRIYNSSTGVEFISNVTVNLPNKADGGFSNSSGNSCYENVRLVGGGTTCEDGIVAFSAKVTNLQLDGTFIPSSSGADAIFLSDCTIDGIFVDNATANKIELRLTNSIVANVLNAIGSDGDLLLSQAWLLTNVLATDGNIDLDTVQQCQNAYLGVGAITNVPLSAIYSNIQTLGSIDLTTNSNYRMTGLIVTSAVTTSGDRDAFTDCQFLGGATVPSGGDNNGFVNCQFGASAGGGALTITIAAGSNNTRVVGCMSDAAISDAGTGTVLSANVVY